ncbi:MAG TPA: class I SAM-dependent methyltransferase [Terriglobia bacterium]|nr:class I SAM-dependent methyltransferase [Terriglobia bacterium]
MTTTPDPGLIMTTLFAFQSTQAFKAAIELDLFTTIASGATRVPEIASQAKASERGIRILCDFLTINGFLTKSGDSYAVSPVVAPFLDARSPAYMGAMANFLAHPNLTRSFEDLADKVRQGGASLGASTVDPENPIWVEFARNMSGFMNVVSATLAAVVARPGHPQKVLDISAGHGMFGIAVARANPRAEVYGLDWKNVLVVARENADKAGVGDRYHEIPGSAFDVPLGKDYDLVLIPNFLHHFDPQTCVGLLKRVKAALKPTGLVATSEFVPNPDRVSPPMPAAFSLQMLAGTPSGDAYTFAELDGMFREAGFPPGSAQPLGHTPQTLILTPAS